MNTLLQVCSAHVWKRGELGTTLQRFHVTAGALNGRRFIQWRSARGIPGSSNGSPSMRCGLVRPEWADKVAVGRAGKRRAGLRDGGRAPWRERHPPTRFEGDGIYRHGVCPDAPRREFAGR